MELLIRSDGKRHLLDTNISLHANHEESLKINMDIHGDPLQANWDGEIYIHGKQLAVKEITGTFPLQMVNGRADINLWTKWEKNKLINASLHAKLNNSLLKVGNGQLQIDAAEFNIDAKKKTDKQWLAALSLSNLDTEHALWPATRHQFNIHLDENNQIDLIDGKLDFVNLHDIVSLIPIQILFKNEWQKNLDWQSLNGKLKNIEFFNLGIRDNSKLYFSSDFDSFSLASKDGTHNANNLNGHIVYKNQNVALEIYSNRSEIKLGSLFDNTLNVTDLEGALSLSLVDSNINVNEFSFNCNDIPFTFNGRISLAGNWPYLDLIARLDETYLENIPLFLPKQTNPELREWISDAFIGGKIQFGFALFRGKINDYPFNDNQGLFQAILNVDKATLNYTEGWPYIDSLAADIRIDNDDLNIDSTSGYIFKSNINTLHAHINDMVSGNHHLIVNSDLSGNFGDALTFINESPLKQNDSLYEFASRNVTGQFEININLDIPLGERESSVDGKIKLNNTMLDTVIPGVSLENINGEVNFTRYQAWSNDIDALYHGKPVKLRIPHDVNDDGESQVIVEGDVDKLFIIQQLGLFYPALLSEYAQYFKALQGETNLEVIIDKKRDDKNKLKHNITIKTNLKGINIDLPAPFKKIASEEKPFIVTTRLEQSRINKIHIKFDSFFDASLSVNNQQDFSIDSIEVGIGDDIKTKKRTDFLISGHIPAINLDEWIHFLNQVDETNVVTNSPDKSFAIELHVDNLILMQNNFSQVKLMFRKTPDGWQTSIEGEKIKGEVNYLDLNKTKTDELHASFDYLHLIKPNDGKESSESISITDFPNVDIKINNLVYEDLNLGQAQIKSIKTDEEVVFNKITFNRNNDVQIEATGTWVETDGVNRSKFRVNITASKLVNLLESLSNDSANIDGGKTSIDMNINWLDTPTDFDLAKINGDIDIDISKGQLLDVNPSAGRLLGLLSITTLPRRLTLDFSDLFNKGFAFDRIEGKFNIEKGEAYTNNLLMTAPAADITITGRTGLINEDYDQVATVLPKVTSSLPVASAILGPIGFGVGAAIYLAGEVFESIPNNINKILSKQYTIRGSWDEPVIEKLENKKSEK